METVYLETTIIGHLTGRIVADPLVAARQHSTREWWDRRAAKYQLFISQLVIDECSDGNKVAVGDRLNSISTFDLLGGGVDTDNLANQLIVSKAIPASEPRDAFHIAIAATNGVKYLLTWNFKHIANAMLRKKIESTCRNSGFEPPIICTPDELMEFDDDTQSDN